MQTALQTSSIPFKTKNIFSMHYLKDILTQSPEWKKYENENKNAFLEIHDLLKKKEKFLEKLSESSLEEEFIRPILRILGHAYDVQESIPHVEGFPKRPDYTFFKSKEELNSIREKDEIEYFKFAIAIGEAKRWNINLDKRKYTDEELEMNPSLQINIYLRIAGIKWGILTNGRIWRLYCKETGFNLDTYYEIDLIDLISEKNHYTFKYFYLFFRREAFVPDVSGKCFLDSVLEGSTRYARELEEDVKVNLYEALKILAKGFLEFPENSLGRENLKEIHDNCLIFLYRMLFVLYSEAKGLLPVDNVSYMDYSMEKLKTEVKKKIDSPTESLLVGTDGYWDRLQNLFQLVNNGSERYKIPKEMLFIPPYNGGLFDPRKHPFLEEYKVGDYYLARALDLLTRSKNKNGEGKVFVDYSTLSIRHLGSIYEGLLEYKLRIAEEPMVAIKDKGKEKWIPRKDYRKKTPLSRVHQRRKVDSGDIFLATDKGERKATGSYYTPDYIVEYIVENALGPLIEEIREKVGDDNKKFVEEVLTLKILDPAMGSGHFLVGATNFLARKIVDFIETEESLEERDEDITLAKRMVVEKCIYGVDSNPLATELAKVSLWLSTVSKMKPLSFLDHHLKNGNSLIGASIRDITGVLPTTELKKGTQNSEKQLAFFGNVLRNAVKNLLSYYLWIVERPSNTIEDIKDKEKNLKEADKVRRKYIQVSNVFVSVYFGNKVKQYSYNFLINSFQSEGHKNFEKYTREDWFERAQEIAEKKKFFHWELEFPEVFFDSDGSRKENSGFDAVIGNPPYIQMSMDARLRKSLQELLIKKYSSSMGRLNTFGFFTKLGMIMVREKGLVSMIVPNTMITMPYYIELRKDILETCRILSLLTFDTLPFKDAIVENIVFVLEKNFNKNSRTNNFIRIDEVIDILTETEKPKNFIKQEEYEKLYKMTFNVYLNDKTIMIRKKLLSNGNQLKKFVEINQAIALKHDRAKYLSKEKVDDTYKKVLDGRDINRYSLVFPKIYLKYDIDAIHSCKRTDIFLSEEKLFFRRVSDQIIVCYDNHQHFALNTLVVINKRPSNKYDLKFLLALLNSKLLNWYYVFFFKSTKEVFSEVQARQVGNLPIRRIEFITPEKEKKKLILELTSLYNKNELDEILLRTEKYLLRDRNVHSASEKEKSDIIHDFLSFLADEIIKMNEKKNLEIQGFLEWLEGTINVRIKNLSGKTKLEEYFKYHFDEIRNILERNRDLFDFNPKNREFLELIRNEYDKSISRLNPLLERIVIADDLIDQIVYKLYGLTEEEIGIVEGRI